MKWVILGLALLAGCAAVPKVEAPECPHFVICKDFCAAANAEVRAMIETELDVNCRCTKRAGDPS
jgi:hypothetical protein